MAEYRPMTTDELVLAVHKACNALVEDGQTPYEVVFDESLEGLLRSGAVYIDIPFDEMTLFGLKFRFDNLPDGVEFIVS